MDQGGSTIWVGVPSDTPDQAATIRRTIDALGGYATRVRGSVELRQSVSVFQPQGNRLATISKLLRQQFDPPTIFNPGLMAA